MASTSPRRPLRMTQILSPVRLRSTSTQPEVEAALESFGLEDSEIEAMQKGGGTKRLLKTPKVLLKAAGDENLKAKINEQLLTIGINDFAREMLWSGIESEVTKLTTEADAAAAAAAAEEPEENPAKRSKRSSKSGDGGGGRAEGARPVQRTQNMKSINLTAGAAFPYQTRGTPLGAKVRVPSRYFLRYIAPVGAHSDLCVCLNRSRPDQCEACSISQKKPRTTPS